MKISIIIPYHNTYDLTLELLNVLVPQLTNETEVIIINDCDNNVFKGVKTLFCESNGTASKPRNIGLDNASGEYITFIDSDDMVVDNYISKIIDKINTSTFDYCLFSWKYNGFRKDEVIITDEPPTWNCSVWNCIYKREAIGDIRFNETMKIAEDYDFNSKVRKEKKENIEDILYFYNEGRAGSIMTGD